MKSRLLHSDRVYRLDDPLPPGADDLARDLGVDALLDAMAGGDPFVRSVARRVVLDPLLDPEEIQRRLDALDDCRAQTAAVRELYAICGRALARAREYWGFGDFPDSVLFRSARQLEGHADALEELRRVADGAGARFRSTAFSEFFARLRAELDDAYLATVRSHLERLEFRDGTWVSAGLGPGLRPSGHVLRLPIEERRSWWQRLTGSRRSNLAFEIGEQDESGARALARQREKGIASVARSLARSNEHLHAFFETLRAELAFYLGAMNLETALRARGGLVARPDPRPEDPVAWSAEGLYDAGLALRSSVPVVPNDLAADGKRLVVITGANQGGKSTFLRALGLAQMLLQAGLFVPARRFRASLAPSIATHFPREEDPTMVRGRLDDELQRMNRATGSLHRHSLLLSNESFASTNEREGSEIAIEVVRALVDSGVRVVAVTHLYEFAGSLRSADRPDAVFLRAERTPDGRRTFRLEVGDPLATSFAADVFARVFGEPLPPIASTAGGFEGGEPRAR
ncbi:MAG TPA: DNA mismatch repair protein MutS [Thermoplasmata archaeon]|nr:DNA mismatch repair protein MutS [Thermoplasmata archaeon]